MLDRFPSSSSLQCFLIEALTSISRHIARSPHPFSLQCNCLTFPKESQTASLYSCTSACRSWHPPHAQWKSSRHSWRKERNVEKAPSPCPAISAERPERSPRFVPSLIMSGDVAVWARNETEIAINRMCFPFGSCTLYLNGELPFDHCVVMLSAQPSISFYCMHTAIDCYVLLYSQSVNPTTVSIVQSMALIMLIQLEVVILYYTCYKTLIDGSPVFMAFRAGSLHSLLLPDTTMLYSVSALFYATRKMCYDLLCIHA